MVPTLCVGLALPRLVFAHVVPFVRLFSLPSSSARLQGPEAVAFSGDIIEPIDLIERNWHLTALAVALVARFHQ